MIVVIMRDLGLPDNNIVSVFQCHDIVGHVIGMIFGLWKKYCLKKSQTFTSGVDCHV